VDHGRGELISICFLSSSPMTVVHQASCIFFSPFDFSSNYRQLTQSTHSCVICVFLICLTLTFTSTLQEERYLPAKVLTAFDKGTPTTVLDEAGENRKLDAAASSQVCDCNPEALDSKIEDLINISDLNEMSILHNLRIR